MSFGNKHFLWSISPYFWVASRTSIGGWVHPKQIWILWREQKYFNPVGNRTTVRRSSSPQPSQYSNCDFRLLAGQPLVSRDHFADETLRWHSRQTPFVTNTVEPRFTNAPIHEQIFRAKNVSDNERCLGLRTSKLATASSWEYRRGSISCWLTLSLLMTYVYGAPCKGRNVNVVYI
jgi:hypothetical protein